MCPHAFTHSGVRLVPCGVGKPQAWGADGSGFRSALTPVYCAALGNFSRLSEPPEVFSPTEGGGMTAMVQDCGVLGDTPVKLLIHSPKSPFHLSFFSLRLSAFAAFLVFGCVFVGWPCHVSYKSMLLCFQGPGEDRQAEEF